MYKVGDKVMIRKDLIEDKEYNGVYCNNVMTKLCGKIDTIKERVQYHKKRFSYHLVNSGWLWSEDMLLPLTSINVEELFTMLLNNQITDEEYKKYTKK